MTDPTRVRISRREFLLFALLMFIAAVFVLYAYNPRPLYLDSFHHYNVAVNLVSGRGLEMDYIWIYLNAPDTLPTPAYLYWMPGTAYLTAAGMLVFGVHYQGALAGFVLCLWLSALLAYWIGIRLSQKRLYGWLSGIMTIFYGVIAKSWGQVDTVTPYMLVGAASLLLMGLGYGRQRQNHWYWLLAGVLAALGHLLRNDGLLLLLTGWAVLLWPFDRKHIKKRLVWLLLFTVMYLLVMLPWFARNLNVMGSVLPTNGTVAAWLTDYVEIFGAPPEATAQQFFADGGQLFLETRLSSVFGEGQLLVKALGYNGGFIFTIFILIALWNRRRDTWLRGVWIFALGVNLAFFIIFPLPAISNSLLHSMTALVPFWSPLGLCGLSDAFGRIAKWRKWPQQRAQITFALIFSGSFLALFWVVTIPTPVDAPAYIETVLAEIDPDSRVMSTNPPEFYYFTGIGGVIVPYESAERTYEITQQYDVDYLIMRKGFIYEPLDFEDNPPQFFQLLFADDDVVIYRVIQVAAQ